MFISPRTHGRRRARRHVLAAGVVASALVLTSCGSDADSVKSVDSDRSPDDGVALLDAGDTADTIVLPVSYDVGQQATWTMTMDIDMSMNVGGESMSLPVGLEMVADQEVTDVTDGITTTDVTFNDITYTTLPPGADAAEGEAIFEPILGKTMRTQTDESGNEVGETRLVDGGEVPAELVDSLESTSTNVLYPSEPVGVGARWSAITTVESNGIEMEAETIYQLVDLNDDEIVIELTQSGPIDTTTDGVRMVGEIEGSGRMYMSRSNPLLLQYSFSQAADFDLEVDGETGSMNMTTDVAIESR